MFICRIICASGLTVSGVEGVPAGHIVHFILMPWSSCPITDFGQRTGSAAAIPTEDDARVVEVMGFRRFSLRAIKSLHWSGPWVCVSYNPQTAFHPQKPRGRGVKLHPEPLAARKPGPADHCSSFIFLFVLHSRRRRVVSHTLLCISPSKWR